MKGTIVNERQETYGMRILVLALVAALILGLIVGTVISAV